MTCATLPLVASGDSSLERLRRMQRGRENATKDERATIIAAGLDGYRQAEVARAIGRSREHVRKVWDAWEAETGQKIPGRDRTAERD